MEEWPLKVLRPVLPQELLRSENRQLLRYLTESLDADPLGMSIEGLLEDIYAGKSFVWTWGDGILLTSFADFPPGKVLHVSNLRGKKFLANLPAIEHDINFLAQEFECRFIKGDVPSAALARKYVELGAKASHFVIREVR